MLSIHLAYRIAVVLITLFVGLLEIIPSLQAGTIDELSICSEGNSVEVKYRGSNPLTMGGLGKSSQVTINGIKVPVDDNQNITIHSTGKQTIINGNDVTEHQKNTNMFHKVFNWLPIFSLSWLGITFGKTTSVHVKNVKSGRKLHIVQKGNCNEIKGSILNFDDIEITQRSSNNSKNRSDKNKYIISGNKGGSASIKISNESYSWHSIKRYGPGLLLTFLMSYILYDLIYPTKLTIFSELNHNTSSK